ncbi:endonuclease MutS2 [Lacrimispora sp.]|uniref:endonuclease MutS2 n=1 Tax=Lacrimispora sp. TaxID=2719234 RepID=UPI0032E4C0DD
MNQKALKTLEYYKIIEQLTEYASCEYGKELCRRLVPSTDYEEITTSLRETTDAVTRVRQKGGISFGGVKDIRASLKRLEVGSSLGMIEILSISSLLSASAKAKAYGRHEDQETSEDSLEEFFRILEPLTPVNNEIKRCIISEEEVSDDASPGLHHVRRSMRSINDKIHTQMNSILNSNRSYLQDAVITMRDGRYCLPVKAEHKSQVTGMVHDQSSTGSTLFIEPMAIVKLNNDLRALEIQEQKEIEMILADLSNQLAPYLEELETNFHTLTRLDFIFAKAALAKHYNASEPIFNTKHEIHIKDGRHPLLDPKKVVPINIHLGKTFDLLIVTGPNTGGKTVSLKTVGLFTLMGQSGLHIPAFDGSELSVFDEVFADIGDEQSIEQSLSTFSSHMTNIVKILNQADSNSLCLFDELGAGTDPTEGAALAISILSFLHNMKCRTMATTHYSELKVFALTTPGVENACCEFNVETLQPTYRILIGVPGKSNAFAISKKLGLPDYIIDEAKNHLEAKDETFEDLLTHLEENRVTIEKESIQIASYKLEVEQLKARLTQKEERLDESRDKMIKNAREEAQRILRDAKDTADSTIRQINKLAGESGVGKELEAERSRLRNKLQDVDSSLSLKREQKNPKKGIDPKKLKLGDGVKVLSMNLNGTVNSLPNAKGDLYVQMGILRSLVNISDLELLYDDSVSAPSENRAKKTGSGSSSTRMSKSFSISPEINLIGMTTDEAIPQLDKYLDDAYLAHLPQVRVVHGRGTGALKNAVHKHLKRLKYVKEFRLGVFGEGDSGVTIVSFK